MNTKKRIYLDYAAATPVAQEVFAEMQPYITQHFGNAGAVHAEGRYAKDAVECARAKLARQLVARPEHVTFTSGGTEANHLALVGYIEQLHENGRPYTDVEILTLKIEHPSVLKTVATLQTRGVKVQYVDVTEEGEIDMQDFRKKLSLKTALVSVAYANSETGVVQPIRKIARTTHTYARDHAISIAVHTDAAQAPLWLPCGIDTTGVDMITFDAGKCYGPKGFGVLVKRHGIKLSPQIRGGGQEMGVRSGTENTPSIIGGVAALLRACKGCEERSVTVARVRDKLLRKIEEAFSDVVVNGSRTKRLPNNINISFPGYDTEYAVVYLDTEGIAVSTKSACGSGNTQGSAVVRAISGDDIRARSTLRITLGEETTDIDGDMCVAILKKWYDIQNRVHI